MSFLSFLFVGDLRSGRCSICEKGLGKILHPPSGGYFGDIDGSTDLYRPDVHKLHEEDFEGLLSEDYIYFEPDRDAEFAKIINNLHSYEHSVLPVMPVTSQSAQASLSW